MDDDSIPRRRRWRRIAVLAGLPVVACSIVVVGMEYISGRSVQVLEDVRRRGGTAHREVRTPWWLESKYLKPVEAWLLPVLPGSLSVSERAVDARRLKDLSQNRELDQLQLDDPNLREEDLGLLARLPQLTQLSLSGSRFTDRAVDFLPRLPRLRSLSFRDTSLTNASLPKLNAWAESISADHLNVDLIHSGVNLARDVKATFPAEAVVNHLIVVTGEFRLPERPAANRPTIVYIETRVFRPDLQSYVTTQTQVLTLKAQDERQNFSTPFIIPSNGDQEWSISLFSVHYGRLSVSYTLASGRIKVSPPAKDDAKKSNAGS